MSAEMLLQLEALRPTRQARVMDLVDAAGVDVSPWAFRQDGSSVRNPAANPNFCYEWAFGGNGEPAVLCVWHPSLVVSSSAIMYAGCIRELALKLDRVAIDRTNPPNVRSRARDQAKRARKFDSLLQRAFRKSEPLRIVILQGEPRAGAEVGWETAEVQYRRLDEASWYVHEYGDDGSFRVLRGVIPAAEETHAGSDAVDGSPGANSYEPDPEPASAPYLDQFSVPDPERRASSGTSFARSSEVRNTVLVRAAGICECCGREGFRTASGAIYLETHHVVPLGEKGPDAEWNVVAICPNDHRRAHHGEDREQIFESLIALLGLRYPAAREMLQTLCARSVKQGADL